MGFELVNDCCDASLGLFGSCEDGLDVRLGAAGDGARARGRGRSHGSHWPDRLLIRAFGLCAIACLSSDLAVACKGFSFSFAGPAGARLSANVVLEPDKLVSGILASSIGSWLT